MATYSLCSRHKYNLLGLCRDDKSLLSKIGQIIVAHMIVVHVCAGHAVEMCLLYSARAKSGISQFWRWWGYCRYCFQQVWVVSVGTKLVSIKWPLRNKTIMKKHRLEYFSFTKLPIYFIVSKWSQCITAFHCWSLLLSYGASEALVAEMINPGIVCVFASESSSPLCLSVYPSFLNAPVTQSPPVCSHQVRTALVGGSINSTPASSSDDTAVVSEEC